MFFCRVYAYAEKLSSGKTYIIRSALDNDYVLDIENKGTKNGTKVQLSHYSEKGAQKFTIQKVKDDYYRIIDVNSGKAVTATDTLGMYLWEWNGKFPGYLTQLFSFEVEKALGECVYIKSILGYDVKAEKIARAEDLAYIRYEGEYGAGKLWLLSSVSTSTRGGTAITSLTDKDTNTNTMQNKASKPVKELRSASASKPQNASSEDTTWNPYLVLGIILAVAIFVTVLLLKAGVNPNSVIHVWVILLFFAGPIFLFRDAIYKALYFVGETIMKIIGSIVAIFILFFYFFGDGEGDRERREGRTDGAQCSHYDRDYCEGCPELNRYDHKYVNHYVDLHRCDDLNRYVDPNKSPEENIRGY